MMFVLNWTSKYLVDGWQHPDKSRGRQLPHRRRRLVFDRRRRRLRLRSRARRKEQSAGSPTHKDLFDRRDAAPVDARARRRLRPRHPGWGDRDSAARSSAARRRRHLRDRSRADTFARVPVERTSGGRRHARPRRSRSRTSSAGPLVGMVRSIARTATRSGAHRRSASSWSRRRCSPSSCGPTSRSMSCESHDTSSRRSRRQRKSAEHANAPHDAPRRRSRSVEEVLHRVLRHEGAAGEGVPRRQVHALLHRLRRRGHEHRPRADVTTGTRRPTSSAPAYGHIALGTERTSRAPARRSARLGTRSRANPAR